MGPTLYEPIPPLPPASPLGRPYTRGFQETHGRVGYEDGVPWNYPCTIAGEFAKHGYQTQAIGKLHVYPERSLIGFHHVILHDGWLGLPGEPGRDPELFDDYIPWLRQQLGREADYSEHGIDVNSVVARPWDKPEYVHPTNFVVAQAIHFLRRRDPRMPYFLFLSFRAPHPPYDPPAWAFEQYVDTDMSPVPVGDWAEIFDPYASSRPDASVARMDPRVLHRARSGYYGHMSHVDQQVNRFLDTLVEYGLRENTYVCFVSDHGEMMGDHHLFRKGVPYEGSARVPLILTGPPTSGIKHGATYRQVLELRDVMPTLLDCANLPVPDCVEG